MRFPSQKPTPSEYAVLAVLGSVVFLILGVIAVVVAVRAPAEQHELATLVMKGGIFSLALGSAIAFGFWFVRRMTE